MNLHYRKEFNLSEFWTRKLFSRSIPIRGLQDLVVERCLVSLKPLIYSPMGDPVIMLSYRRSDSLAETGRIYDHLVRRFGKISIFRDVDSIPLGKDFRECLEHAVEHCKVLIAIIGPNWLDIIDEDGNRRLDSPTDLLRLEIEAALRREIPVIPVLVNGGEMPKVNALPRKLRAITRLQGIRIQHDPSFKRDMHQLIDGIEKLLRIS